MLQYSKVEDQEKDDYFLDLGLVFKQRGPIKGVVRELKFCKKLYKPERRLDGQ